MSSTAESDLVHQAVAGERQALSRLLVLYHERLAGHIRRKLPPDMRATLGVEDVQQQAYIQAFRDIQRFQPTTASSFYPWLRTIADNRLIEEIRKQRALKRGGELNRVVSRETPSGVHMIIDRLSGRDETPSVCVSRKEAVRAVQIQLAGLPDDLRDIAQLRWLEGLSVDQISERTGRSEGAIRGVLYRVKRSLREAMGDSTVYFRR